jgi:hypothetical protein
MISTAYGYEFDISPEEAKGEIRRADEINV